MVQEKALVTIQRYKQEKQHFAKNLKSITLEKVKVEKEKVRVEKEKVRVEKEKVRVEKEKDKQIIQLKQEKLKITTKLIAQKKRLDEKKKNLEKYRKKKTKTRKKKISLDEQIKEILGREDKWTNHSLSQPKSHRTGKPKGAKGGGKKRPEVIHKETNHFPQTCPKCGTSLADEYMIRSHDSVITELFHEPDEFNHYRTLQLKNIKKNIYRARCPNPECRNICSPNLGLFKGARFGPAFISYVIGDRIETALPFDAIIGEMKKMFGYEFSLTAPSIINWFEKFEEQIKIIYEQLEEAMKKQLFVHIDETGLSMQGQNWWLWVICCANIVLYHESSSRGHDAIKELIKGFEGTIIADFFSAYEKFDKNEHQKCIAHLLSDIIEHVVKLTKENRKIAERIEEHKVAKEQEILEKLENYKKGRGRPKIRKQLTDEIIIVLEAKKTLNEKSLKQAVILGGFFRQPFYETMFSWERSIDKRYSKKEAEEELQILLEDLRSEGIKDETIARLVKRCIKYKEKLFTYLKLEKMPPDNNLAERALRKFARQRKISGDFKSVDLLRNYTMYLSLFMTCKKNDLDFDNLLYDIISGESVDIRPFLIK